MSNPDIMLTIKAYTMLKIKYQNQLHAMENKPKEPDVVIDLQKSIERLEELTTAMENEWCERGNA